jgi:DNA repair exonuclease SbcCD nuclease subunit
MFVGDTTNNTITETPEIRRMTCLITSDLHFNETLRDSYRWDILPWLEKKATELEVDFIFVGGDITDAKDRHSATLVNRLTDFLAKSKHHWVIIAGNHDMISPDTPFFRYLDHFKNIKLIYEPTVLHLPVGNKKTSTLLLPASRDWETLWPPNFGNKYDYIFMHGTFAGTKSESGFELPGMPVSFFSGVEFNLLYSGDIHTPGIICEQDFMEYIGAPYRVHFGDVYNPRVIHIGEKVTNDIHPPMKSRHVIVVRGPQDLEHYNEIYPGDQVKLRVRLKRAEFTEWRKIRAAVLAEAKRLEWEECGIELLELSTIRHRLGEIPTENTHKTPEDYLREYAAKQKWSKQITDFGLTLLKG